MEKRLRTLFGITFTFMMELLQFPSLKEKKLTNTVALCGNKGLHLQKFVSKPNKTCLYFYNDKCRSKLHHEGKEVFWRHVCNRCGKEGHTDNNCAFLEEQLTLLTIFLLINIF
jgi:hypothetical protein